MMQLLREDLAIFPKKNSAGCYVLDPSTGKEYEFGAVEQFLIEQFRKPYDLEHVRNTVNSQFDLQFTSDNINEFLNLLSEWGLLDSDKNQGQRIQSRAQEDFIISKSTKNVDKNTPSQHNSLYLFNPEKLLDSLLRIFSLFRFIVWLTPLILAVAIITVLSNWNTFLADLSLANARFGFFGRLLFAALTLSFISQIARGLVARHFGLVTPSFSLVFFLGLIPRFNIQIILSDDMARRNRLWLIATSTLVRLWVFGGTSLFWALTRISGTSLSSIAIEFAFVSIIGLLFIANPLWPGEGANFLSTWLEIPDMQRRSRKALWRFIFGQPDLVKRYSRKTSFMIPLGLATVIVFLGVVGYIIYKLFTYFESHYHGAGVALFLLLSIYISMVMRRVATKDQTNPNVIPIKQQQMNNMHQIPQSESKLRHHWGKYLLIIIAMGCLFLPYQYETGGNAEVFPSARVSITADIEGIIEEVYFKGGERVQPGTVLARIADYNQINQLNILDAEIEGKRYEIERYRSTPSIEDIKLAEKKISIAKTHAQYSQEKLKKQESLFEKGFISLQALEDARVTAERDKQLLDEAIASLKALKAQINPFQIETLKTELEKLQRQASYNREKLRRTNLVTPIGGRIVTTDLQYQLSSYLEAGKKFADIEDTDTIIVRAAIPESDLFEISDKAPLTLKLYAYPNRKFEGVVDEIEVIANTADYGRVVYVRGHISNPDGAIKTGLTGYAKIQGNETIVLLAFTRALTRFVTIDIWSWLP